MMPRRWPRSPIVNIGLAALAAPPLLVLLLRFVPPPTSAFMLASPVRPVDYRWVAAGRIAPAAALAAVAAEDQKFPEHWGFDFEALQRAAEHNAHSRRVRGGSTITQQTAKNLFLWSGRSYLRKGLEAGFTLLLEGLWPKRRILEVYLNIAQFGPGIYGVQAASLHYFGKPAARLSRHEAALLAAVLPNPVALHVDQPSPYVRARSAEIETQMNNLGDSYLRAAWRG